MIDGWFDEVLCQKGERLAVETTEENKMKAKVGYMWVRNAVDADRVQDLRQVEAQLMVGCWAAAAWYEQDYVNLSSCLRQRLELWQLE